MEEVSVLIGKSQSGDKEAREVLIEKNLGLVHHIVKRFLGRGYDPEDLFQIGVIGLMKAIDKFDLKLELRCRSDWQDIVYRADCTGSPPYKNCPRRHSWTEKM